VKEEGSQRGEGTDSEQKCGKKEISESDVAGLYLNNKKGGRR